MRSSRLGLSTMLAMAAIQGIATGYCPPVDPINSSLRKTRPVNTNLTDEQLEWNAAVDARNAAKKAVKQRKQLNNL